MNTNVDLLLENSTLADGSKAFVGISKGKISSISRERPGVSAAERVDLNGALLTLSLIDGHMHLDTTLFGDSVWHPHRPCRDGFDVAERIQIQKEVMAIADPVGHRAGKLVEQAVARGTGCIRTHVEIDSHYGLSHFEATLETRERYRDVANIQIVGLARGMLLDDKVRDLMNEALRNGADIVGGLDPAGFEGNIQLHLDTIFAMADQHGVGIDLHLHDGGSLGLYELSQIAERSLALGMQGKVSVSHAYALGEMPWDAVAPVAAQLAESGVSIMTNAPGNQAFPPIVALGEAGVNVFAGNDDIRDAWWPYGDADMLERVMLIGYRSGLFMDKELNALFDMAGRRAATALGIGEYCLAVGAPADLMALPVKSIAEAVVARPRKRTVLKAGKIVAQGGKFTACL